MRSVKLKRPRNDSLRSKLGTQRCDEFLEHSLTHSLAETKAWLAQLGFKRSDAAISALYGELAAERARSTQMVRLHPDDIELIARAVAHEFLKGVRTSINRRGQKAYFNSKREFKTLASIYGIHNLTRK